MKNTGFSLVELIVVIAIMAILAGVAVPAYSHYVDQSKEDIDDKYLMDVYHAAELEAAYQGKQVASICVSLDGQTISVLTSADVEDEDLTAAVKGMFPKAYTFQSSKYTASDAYTADDVSGVSCNGSNIQPCACEHRPDDSGDLETPQQPVS